MDLKKIFLKEACPTSIGGQAIMEGIMMRGPKKTAIAVRLPDGNIQMCIRDRQKGTAAAEGEDPADQNTDSKADMNQAASPSKTGDEATLLLWSLMAAAGAIGLFSLRRKENR